MISEKNYKWVKIIAALSSIMFVVCALRLVYLACEYYIEKLYPSNIFFDVAGLVLCGALIIKSVRIIKNEERRRKNDVR